MNQFMLRVHVGFWCGYKIWKVSNSGTVLEMLESGADLFSSTANIKERIVILPAQFFFSFSLSWSNCCPINLYQHTKKGSYAFPFMKNALNEAGMHHVSQTRKSDADSPSCRAL